MAFETNCTNKGCGEFMTPMLDKVDGQVYCSKCDKPLNNIPHFTKIQLKSLGQFRKPKKEAFSVKCGACKTEALPKLVNDKLMCVACGKEHTTVSKPFEPLIKKAIKEKEQEQKNENSINRPKV